LSATPKPFMPSYGMPGMLSEAMSVLSPTTRLACIRRLAASGGMLAASGLSPTVMSISIFPPSVFS
jgi:hypothetical protein